MTTLGRKSDQGNQADDQQKMNGVCCEFDLSPSVVHWPFSSAVVWLVHSDDWHRKNSPNTQLVLLLREQGGDSVENSLFNSLVSSKDDGIAAVINVAEPA